MFVLEYLKQWFDFRDNPFTLSLKAYDLFSVNILSNLMNIQGNFWDN